MGVRRRSQRVSTGSGSTGVMQVSPRPRGSTRIDGQAPVSTGGFTTVVSYTPVTDTTFSLSKILVAWGDAIEMEISVSLGAEVIATYFATEYVMDWFPDGVSLPGDGVAAITVAAKAVSGNATLIGYIAGEIT